MLLNNDFYLLKVETITENNEQSQEYLDIYYCITGGTTWNQYKDYIKRIK